MNISLAEKLVIDNSYIFEWVIHTTGHTTAQRSADVSITWLFCVIWPLSCNEFQPTESSDCDYIMPPVGKRRRYSAVIEWLFSYWSILSILLIGNKSLLDRIKETGHSILYAHVVDIHSGQIISSTWLLHVTRLERKWSLSLKGPVTVNYILGLY